MAQQVKLEPQSAADYDERTTTAVSTRKTATGRPRSESSSRKPTSSKIVRPINGKRTLSDRCGPGSGH